jgi:hypothetical protein
LNRKQNLLLDNVVDDVFSDIKFGFDVTISGVFVVVFVSGVVVIGVVVSILRLYIHRAVVFLYDIYDPKQGWKNQFNSIHELAGIRFGTFFRSMSIELN